MGGRLHSGEGTVRDPSFLLHRAWVVPVMLLGLSGFVFAATFESEWFLQRFRRMGGTNALLVVSSEAIALFWYVRFLVLHGLMGRGVSTKRVLPSARWSTATALICSLLLGATFDASMSYRLWKGLARRYEEAHRIEGHIGQFSARTESSVRGSEVTFYEILADYEFEGRPYQLEVKLEHNPAAERERAENGIRPMWEYQPELLDKLKEGRRPIPVRMRVNPERPVESWIEMGPLGRPTADFEFLSSMQAFLQLLTVIGVGSCLVGALRKRRLRRVPWWIELSHLLPVTLEGGLLLLLVATG